MTQPTELSSASAHLVKMWCFWDIIDIRWKLLRRYSLPIIFGWEIAFFVFLDLNETKIKFEDNIYFVGIPASQWQPHNFRTDGRLFTRQKHCNIHNTLIPLHKNNTTLTKRNLQNNLTTKRTLQRTKEPSLHTPCTGRSHSGAATLFFYLAAVPQPLGHCASFPAYLVTMRSNGHTC